MSEVKNLKTFGIYELTVLKDVNGEKLAVGIRAPYRNRPQYNKHLDSEFSHFKDFDHPNILKYEELLQRDDQGYCLTMEWEEARPLAEYAAEAHSEEQKKAIITQIAEALDYMHVRGCIHAALSPSVIFITTKDDTVKIINFRQRYADGLKQPADSVKFIAPEAKDGTVTLDVRADIYSLGQLIRYLDMPLSYEPIIKGCCSFGRSERFGNIETFLTAFNHQKDTHIDYSGIGTAASRCPKVGKRAVYGIFAVAAIVVTTVALWSFGKNNNNTNDGDTVKTEQLATDAKGDVSSTNTQITSAGDVASSYTGDLAFLNELMPQVKTDLDNIYKKAKNKKSASKKVSRYYKGLHKVLVGQGLQASQLSAFDQAFGDYNAQKKAEPMVP